MYRLLPALALALAVASPSGFTAAPADWVPGQRMSVAVTGVIDAAREHQDDYALDTQSVCLLAGFMNDGRELTFNRPFDKGENYLVIVGTDRNVAALDVDVFDAAGERVTGETRDTAPEIRLRPAKTGTYKLRVCVTKVREKGAGGFCTLMILRKGTGDVPIANARGCLETVIAGAEDVYKAANSKQMKRSVWFQSGNNQWSMYGSVLDQGNEMTITKVKLGKGDRMLVAAGDKNSQDVDVFVLDEDDEVLARDRGREPSAVLKFTEDEDKYRAIRFKNAAARRSGPCLILAAVLTIDD